MVPPELQCSSVYRPSGRRSLPTATRLLVPPELWVQIRVQAKWEETEEKPAVVAVGVSALIVVWAVSGLVDRLDKLPLVGGFLELVGLLVTGWFTYRYLTFAPDRWPLCPSWRHVECSCLWMS